jgi:hypothetical protein
MAQRIDVSGDRITFVFAQNQKWPHTQLEQNRAWLETAAQKVVGRKMSVNAVLIETPAAAAVEERVESKPRREAADLEAEARSSSAVQAMLDVFPGTISDIEEM